MADDLDRSHLPIPNPTFTGTSNRTLEGSEPDWTMTNPVDPPSGAPNVLLVLIDDAGFGNTSTFGGPIETPTFTRMADGGLRYNRFHVTALCSPTRAAMLTGRNHHAVGFGAVTETPAGFPGYGSVVPQSSAPMPKILQGNGYATAAIGKWHMTPDHQQGPSGPFDRWPLGWGFDYFWGFLGGESGQYDPLLVENNTVLGPPAQRDYYFPDDMAAKAISWLHGFRAQDAERPFFMYFSTGCSHAPHQVPKEWSDKYKGKFDSGWDQYRQETFERQTQLGVIPAGTELTPSPLAPGTDDPAFPSWDSLDEDDKRLYARQMEVFAGYQENADWNVGRVIDAIEAMGELDNTVVIWVWGDNGASMEGTLTGTFNELTTENGIPLTAQQQRELLATHGGLPAWGTEVLLPHYSAAWAWAGNCPFPWGKQVAAYLGGTRNPMVVHWPACIGDGVAGGLRSQFTHVIDVAPTILEVAGIPLPSTVDGFDQVPMHGASFADSLSDAGAAEHHTQQYFEIYGNRAMYKDGWWLATMLPRIPWDGSPQTMAQFAPDVWDPDTDPVQLFYLPDDFSQAHDLSAENPDKVDELRQLLWDELERYQATPLLAAFGFYWGVVPPPGTQSSFPFAGDVVNVAPGMIPPIYSKSYAITADLTVPDGGAEGVIVAEANSLGGFSLFVQDGKLKHTYSMLGVKEYRQEATTDLPAGDVRVRMEFVADSPGTMGTGGTVTLYVNDESVGTGRMDNTVPHRFTGYAGLDIGRDNGTVVDRHYAREAPFAFTGTINSVVFEIEPLPTMEDELAAHQALMQGRVTSGMGA
ncbi:MAG: arylsulfatase [Acidimicrobiales bacterium]